MSYSIQQETWSEPASLGDQEYRQSPKENPLSGTVEVFPAESKPQIDTDWYKLIESYYKKQLIDTRKLLIGKISTVCGGDPIILGTRITVANVIEKYLAGKNSGDILKDYPHLNEIHIQACFEYYERNTKEIDALISEDQALVE